MRATIQGMVDAEVMTRLLSLGTVGMNVVTAGLVGLLVIFWKDSIASLQNDKKSRHPGGSFAKQNEPITSNVTSRISVFLRFYRSTTFRSRMTVLGELVESQFLLFSFLVALGSMVGSLFYSEVMKLPPCSLCWLQRMFMYPLTPLLGLAVLKKDRGISEYVFVLSAIGGAIALYQYLLQFGLIGEVVKCSVGSLSSSCSEIYVQEFGYVTIPFMALSAFVLLIVLSLFGFCKAE